MSVQTLSQIELHPFKGLWHGIKLKNFVTYLEKGCLEARTSHRHWKGGLSFNESHPEYTRSTYVKGWSFTRERDYAFGWSDITLLLDYELIKRDFKVLPISWSARRNPINSNKIEMEEFVVSNFEDKTEYEIQKEYSDLIHNLDGEEKKSFLKEYPDWFCYIDKVGTRKINIQKYVKGFFIANDLVDLYVDEIEELKQHPLFKGFYDMDAVSKPCEYKSLNYFKNPL